MRDFSIIICIVIFLTLVSCTREVPYIPKDADVLLMMNAQIDAASKSHRV